MKPNAKYATVPPRAARRRRGTFMRNLSRKGRSVSRKAPPKISRESISEVLLRHGKASACSGQHRPHARGAGWPGHVGIRRTAGRAERPGRRLAGIRLAPPDRTGKRHLSSPLRRRSHPRQPERVGDAGRSAPVRLPHRTRRDAPQSPGVVRGIRGGLRGALVGARGTSSLGGRSEETARSPAAERPDGVRLHFPNAVSRRRSLRRVDRLVRVRALSVAGLTVAYATPRDLRTLRAPP